MEDIKYKWFQGGGFIIRFREDWDDYELLEVPVFGGKAMQVELFSSVEEAKAYADMLA